MAAVGALPSREVPSIIIFVLVMAGNSVTGVITAIPSLGIANRKMLPIGFSLAARIASRRLQ